jgi:hypothetical protein
MASGSQQDYGKSKSLDVWILVDELVQIGSQAVARDRKGITRRALQEALMLLERTLRNDIQ